MLSGAAAAVAMNASKTVSVIAHHYTIVRGRRSDPWTHGGREVMDPESVQLLTSAVAPVVMVSAAGLLFMGMQAKNLHLADRVRALTAESRALPPDSTQEPRRRQIADQLVMFRRRLVLSQRAL